jgi:hypothetical protein
MPMDLELWKYENYREFLKARRELLAKAANEFLDSLYAGSVPEPEPTLSVLERDAIIVPGGIADDEEDRTLRDCNQWVIDQGLPAGELSYNLTDADSGKDLAILDLAWPDGLQEGYSQPVALLLDEGNDTEAVANQAGFRFFTDVATLKTYVNQEILALELPTA